MQTLISPLYNRPIPDLGKRLSAALDNGLAAGVPPVQVFFRADDIGVPSPSFFRMIELFERYRTPLCLALVPAWLSRTRWRHIAARTASTSLFCHHQHGWRHVNHEAQGKKQEFGDSRSREAIEADLLKGRERLTALLGKDFQPYFTPPWNRCGQAALASLQRLGFAAISRSTAATPASPAELPDFAINVDLHTRKEADRERALDHLLAELRAGAAAGRIGCMLHHQRMNGQAFIFLETLLQTMSAEARLERVGFGELGR